MATLEFDPISHEELVRIRADIILPGTPSGGGVYVKPGGPTILRLCAEICRLRREIARIGLELCHKSDPAEAVRKAKYRILAEQSGHPLPRPKVEATANPDPS